MLIGVGFLGEEEMLVIREENLVIRSKVAQKRGRLSIFVLWDTIIDDVYAVWVE